MRVKETPLLRLSVTVHTDQAEREVTVAYGKTAEELVTLVGAVDEPGWESGRALVRQSPEMYTTYVMHG